MVMLLTFIVSGCSPPASVNEPVVNETESPQEPVPFQTETNTNQVKIILACDRQQVHAGEKLPLFVKFIIRPGWEIQSLSAPPPMIATKIELELPDGFALESEWQEPQATLSASPDGHSVYAGTATFEGVVLIEEGRAAADVEIKADITFQACDEKKCLPPETVSMVLPVRVGE